MINMLPFENSGFWIDLLIACISGLFTLTAAYVAWRFAMRLESKKREQDLHNRKMLIEQEIEDIVNDVTAAIGELKDQLNQLSFRQSSYKPRFKIMTAAFDEHFKHASIVFDKNRSQQVKRLYSHVLEFNLYVIKFNEECYKLISDSSDGNSELGQVLASVQAAPLQEALNILPYIEKRNFIVINLLSNAREIILLSGVSCTCKADEAKEIIDKHFSKEKR